MIDILFTVHNRPEFTRASLSALLANTDWKSVERLFIYDDGSCRETAEFIDLILARWTFPVETVFRRGTFGGPVAVMNDLLETTLNRDGILAKIDNDTMLPPGWLEETLAVLEANPEVDLLGIEAMFPVEVGQIARNIVPAEYVGGIGLMRTRCFTSLPRPQGRFGFTAWQDQHSEVKKAWISPSIPVFLLDRIPFEPWHSLSCSYVAKGWQRQWEPYQQKDEALWQWWAQ